MAVTACDAKYKSKQTEVYLSVSWLDIQNVSFGGRPLEGKVRNSIAKGEGCLTIGQTHDVHRHLREVKGMKESVSLNFFREHWI